MRHLAFFGAIQFHKQNNAQPHWYAQLENGLNFYFVGSALCAIKIGVNLIVLKLPVECWWNWPLVIVDGIFQTELTKPGLGNVWPAGHMRPA